MAPGAQAATFVVTKTLDTNDGACDADCSLREAIRAANATVGVADVITVPAGTYTLTIPGNTEDAAATGDLDIRDTVTINGAGATTTIIQAGTTVSNGIDKVFSVNQLGNTSASATFNGVTVQFGRNTSPCDFAVTFAHLGAGIDFFGGVAPTTTSLTITNSVITGNTVANACAPGVGAGVSADDGNLTITNSTITNNETTNQPGGGVSFFGNSRTMVMTDTIVSNNRAKGGVNGEGGGIFVRQNANGTVMIHNSEISNNTSESRGGGIKLESTPGPLTATIDQTTRITGNTSLGTGTGISEGGGLDISTLGASTTTVKDVTITINHANNPANSGGKGGGIFNNLGTLNVSLSRITGNTAPAGSGLFVAAGTATAENNWWGCDDFPGAVGCDTVSGTAGSDPRLDLKVTATPSAILSGGTSSVNANLSTNSNNAAVLPVVLNGLPIAFAATNGTMSPTSSPLAAFMANSTYTNTSCPSPPPEMVSAKLDNGPETADITVDCNADLAILKTDNPDPVEVGSNLTYTLAVTNNGPNSATNVTLTDLLPAGVTFVSATPTQGSCSQAAGTVTCNLGSLAVGPIATVTLVVTPTAPGPLTNTASVTGNGQPDPNAGNNTATEQTTVNPAPTTTTTTTLPPTTTTTTLPPTTTTTTLPPTTTTTTLPPTTTTTTLPPTTTTTTLPPTTTTTLPQLTCNGRQATIVGTNGNDTITGTNGNDVIVGLGGNDTINGGNGDDVICGGDGNDTLNGGNGTDRLFGQNNNDVLNGDNGNDALDGGPQTDVCNGGNGSDTAASCEGGTGVP